jgi:hypothetical protein
MIKTTAFVLAICVMTTLALATEPRDLLTP